MDVLKKEISVLRDRIEYLERLLLHSYELPAGNNIDSDCGSQICAFCQEAHTIRSCGYYQYLQIGDRWRVAKKLGLCYRCLEKSHFVRDCLQSRTCGVNHCRLTHNRLLHDEGKRNSRRKLKANRNAKPGVASLFEPSRIDGDVQNGGIWTDPVCSGPIELGATPAPSSEENNSEVGETHFLDNLDSFHDADSLNPYGEEPHAGKTTACDGGNDCQQMDELNRLAMLAEREVPFDVIFSGSCRKSPDSDGSGHVNEMCDGEADSIERSEEGPVFNAPSGGENYSDMDFLDSFISECAPPEGKLGPDLPSGGNLGVQVENIAPLSKCENAGFEPEGNLDGTGPSENNNGFIENRYAWLTTRMEKSGMFYNRRDGHSYTSAKSLELQKVANDVALQQLAQKYRTNESTCTLLDTLNNQINRLDKEISFYETIVPPDPPAEIADKTLEPIENMSSPNLSTWLMPIHL